MPPSGESLRGGRAPRPAGGGPRDNSKGARGKGSRPGDRPARGSVGARRAAAAAAARRKAEASPAGAARGLETVEAGP